MSFAESSEGKKPSVRTRVQVKRLKLEKPPTYQEKPLQFDQEITLPPVPQIFGGIFSAAAMIIGSHYTPQERANRDDLKSSADIITNHAIPSSGYWPVLPRK